MLGRLKYYYQRLILKRLTSDQRRYFDNIIVPRYSRRGNVNLFIGIEWYNEWIFKKYKHVKWVSIDPFEKNTQFGATNHFTGTFPRDLSISEYTNKFDVVFCNGVYGWGVNSSHELSEVLENISVILKPGGLCIFGYNTEKEHNPLTETTLLRIVNRYFSLISRERVCVDTGGGEDHVFCILKPQRESVI